MGSSDINLSSLRASKYKGYLQMQDPDSTSNYLRLKERQTMSISFNFQREGHYDDQGQKINDPSGYSHSFSCSIKTTPDMFDKSFRYDGAGDTDNVIPTDKSTISYWIYKNQIYEPVELIFITTMETLGTDTNATTGNKYLHLKFTCDVNAITPVTLSGATSETTISGEILRVEAVKRTGVSTTLSG